LARLLKVRRVDVCSPFGGVPSTVPTPPVVTSTRLRTFPAAFGRPGAGPAIRPPAMNWARANPVATVVRSLSTTSVGTDDVPSVLANLPIPRSAVTYRTASAPAGGVYEIVKLPSPSLTA